jgi:hypothetical protein
VHNFINSHEIYFLMDKQELKRKIKLFWNFVWHDDSPLSWVVNIILAFLIIKFLVYPGLSMVLGTEYPVVAVVSCSMEHGYTNCGSGNVHLCGVEGEGRANLDQYWEACGAWYDEKGISKATFSTFRFKNGFNKGDIMILGGVNPEKVQPGEVLVFQSSLRVEPIIHRLITKTNESGEFTFQTKGDHNAISHSFESSISEDALLGKAIFRIPFLGYVKIWFVNVLGWIGLA